MADCSAPHQSFYVTGIRCEEPEGHDGPHVAWRPIKWQDDEPDGS